MPGRIATRSGGGPVASPGPGASLACTAGGGWRYGLARLMAVPAAASRLAGASRPPGSVGTLAAEPIARALRDLPTQVKEAVTLDDTAEPEG